MTSYLIEIPPSSRTATEFLPVGHEVPAYESLDIAVADIDLSDLELAHLGSPTYSSDLEVDVEVIYDNLDDPWFDEFDPETPVPDDEDLQFDL